MAESAKKNRRNKQAKHRKAEAKSAPAESVQDLSATESVVDNQESIIDSEIEADSLNSDQSVEQLDSQPQSEIEAELVEVEQEYSLNPDYSAAQEQDQDPEQLNAASATADPNQPIITARTSSGTPSKINLSSTLAALAQPKPWLWLGGIVIAIVAILTMWWQWQRSYVAVVNGQYIPTSALVSQVVASGGSTALTNLTQQYLVNQEAYKQNITISQQTMDKELQTLIDGSGGQEQYEAALKQYGISENYIINQIRTKQLLIALTKDKIQVSDDDVKNYYETNKDTIDPDGSRGFDNIKDSVRTQLLEQKQEAEFSTFLQSLQEKSKVSTNLDHASLTFFDFLNNEILSIPQDVANLFSVKK